VASASAITGSSSLETIFVTPETLTIMRERRSCRRASRATLSRM